jgi:hypothetical protein
MFSGSGLSESNAVLPATALLAQGLGLFSDTCSINNAKRPTDITRTRYFTIPLHHGNPIPVAEKSRMGKRYVNTPVAGLKSLPLPAQPLVLALGVVCLLAVRPLSAKAELVIGDRVAVDLGIKAAAGYFGTWNTNFGLGRLDFRTGANTGDAHWGEAYLEPSVDAELALDGWGHLYGGISGVGVLTEGDGDAGGFTNDGDDDLDLEHLFIGWRSFSEATGEPALDLSFGRQEFRIGNGFLIYDGDLDQLEKGASWLSPRESFERAGLVRLDMAPAHADLFYLNADRDHDETALAGFNFEYAFQDPTRVGFTYLHIFDSIPRFWGVRAGMNVLDLRVNELALPHLPEISFSGEYVKEIGWKRRRDRRRGLVCRANLCARRMALDAELELSL